MAKHGMVIDLLKCAGCGACGVGCKTQNNTDDAHDGQTFNWADYCESVEGKFPKANYTLYPTLCNHCDDAPCVQECPVSPTAMYKAADGTTLHNEERCIGCGMCQRACPYSSNVGEDQAAKFSVISINNSAPQARFASNKELVKGCTTSGAEIAAKTGATPPYRTMHDHPDYNAVRGIEKAEKCIFCAHLVADGKQPYCVQVCPSQARVFGDLNDRGSAISKLLAQHGKTAVALADNKGKMQKIGAGTKPNVFYIRSFSARR